MQIGSTHTARIVVIVSVLVVVALSIGIVAAEPEQEPNNPRDNAQEIALDEEVTGALPSGDVDWFRFTAESGKVIRVNASTDDVGNTNFELLDGNDNQLAGLSGLTAASGTTGATSVHSGTYYLRVERRFSDRGGEYNFTVETIDSDGFEPNEDQGNATRVSNGEEIQGEMTIGDTDWFGFTAAQGDAINITAFADANGATSFQLYDRNGSLLTSDDGVSGRMVRINETAPYTGEYAVRVTPRFENYGASYNLTVNLPGESSSTAEATTSTEAQTDDSGGGLPIVIVGGGFVLIAALVVIIWRSQDEKE